MSDSGAIEVMKQGAKQIANGFQKFASTFRENWSVMGDGIENAPRQLTGADRGSAIHAGDNVRESGLRPMDMAELRARALGSEISTGLGNNIDALVRRSPTLTARVRNIQRDGWLVRYGDRGSGDYMNSREKTITVDGRWRDDDVGTVAVLAHETRHADPQAYQGADISPDGKTREEWIKLKAMEQLRREGDAVLAEAEVRREILDDSGPEISVPRKYVDIYEKFRQEDLSPESARDAAAEMYGDEIMSSSRAPYREWYEKMYRKLWDEEVDNNGTE